MLVTASLAVLPAYRTHFLDERGERGGGDLVLIQGVLASYAIGVLRWFQGARASRIGASPERHIEVPVYSEPPYMTSRGLETFFL